MLEESSNTKSIDAGTLESLINNMSDAVIALDEDFRVTLYNASALNLIDSNESIIGKKIYEFLNLIDKNDDKVDVKKIFNNLKKVINSKDYKILYNVDNSSINIQLTVAPVHAGFNKKNGGYVVSMRDITLEKSLDDERDEFISVVSHELRNPIAIAEGNLSNALYSIDKGSLTNDIRHEIDQSHKQIIFLTELINDLTNLARAENNKNISSTEIINANEIIEELSSEYEPKASDKGIQIKTKSDPNLESINSSKLYVKEILQNFITNSIKYSEKGTILITAKMMTNGISFSVSDDGIGISKADEDKVFNKFFRSGDYRTSKESGTGLGLYISAKLAKILSGKITLNSTINHGSTFTVFIPDHKQ
jgi:two-component system sensor histidine kinase VicK